MRKWHNIFQVLKEINCQYRLLYSVKISFRDERKIETFKDEKQLKICHQHSYLKTMAKCSPLNTKEMTIEGILEYQ